MRDKPAETWPVGHFVEEEMRERGWTRQDLAMRLRGPLTVNRLALDIMIDLPQEGVLIGKDLADDLALAFGTSPEFWLNLDNAWQQRSSGDSG